MKLNYSQELKLLDKDLLKIITKEELDKIINNLQPIKVRGSFARCYTDGKHAIKKYFDNPYLCSSSLQSEIFFNQDDVVDNLLNMIDMHHEDVAFTNRFYVVNHELLAYRTDFIEGVSLNDVILSSIDIHLNDFRKIWLKSYEIADYFTENDIVAYDINVSNCKINSGNIKFYDTDFYHKEPFSKTIEYDNYDIINTLFINFIEDYFFDGNYKCRNDKYLKRTTNYVDDAIEELLLASSGNCKTLKDVANNL